MTTRWSKEDRAAWDNSEVAQELEKKILNVIAGLNKMSADLESIKELADNAPSITNAINGVASAVDRLESGADDGEADEDSVEEDAGEKDDGPGVTAEAVVERLRSILKEATDNKEFELAYRIERTIDEILDEE